MMNLFLVGICTLGTFAVEVHPRPHPSEKVNQWISEDKAQVTAKVGDAEVPVDLVRVDTVGIAFTGPAAKLEGRAKATLEIALTKEARHIAIKGDVQKPFVKEDGYLLVAEEFVFVENGKTQQVLRDCCGWKMD